jgi:2-polyprenyl-3-methyl-5-hydroxy-6-metoxy-1,4-benzoquinol methylase
MDQITLDCYNTNAKDLAKRNKGAPCSLAPDFASAFIPGGRVLDIGCGSGRDLAELHKLGFQPYGLEGTSDLM